MVRRVRNQEAAVGGRGHVVRIVEGGSGCHPTIAAESGDSVPRDRCDRAVGRNPTNPLIDLVGDKKAAVRQGTYTERTRESCARRRPPVTAEALDPGARDGRDRPGRRNAPNYVVARIGEEEAPVAGGDDATRVVDRCRCRRTTIAAVTPIAVSDHRRDRAVRRDFPDPVVARIGQEKAPVSGH